MGGTLSLPYFAWQTLIFKDTYKEVVLSVLGQGHTWLGVCAGILLLRFISEKHVKL